MPVPLVGELLELVVLDVSHAEPEHAQKNTALGLCRDQLDQRVVVRDSNVEITVRGQNHTIRAILDEALGGDVIGELNSRGAVRRAAGVKIVDGRTDRGSLDARSGG